MSLPPYLKMHGDAIHLHIKVQPRASRNEIGAALGDELKIKVTAPPVDSAANEALVRFVAEVLDCPRSCVQLIRGPTSRHKVVAIRGLSAKHITDALVSKPDK
jgi:hypothetical protein